MKKIRHFAVGLLLFSVIIGLFLTAYNDFSSSYGWTEGDVQSVDGTVGNIAHQLNNTIIVQSLSLISASVYDDDMPTGGDFDITGAILSMGLGFLGTFAGIIIFPFQIGFIIAQFYGGDVPGVLLGTLLQGIVIYIAFIIISSMQRNEI